MRWGVILRENEVGRVKRIFFMLVGSLLSLILFDSNIIMLDSLNEYT